MKEITIIEDDKVMQYLLKSQLVKHGYKVNSVIDSKEIFENDKLLNVDLIILDIMMPNMFDSSKLISIYQKIKVPIIVISSMEKDDGIYFTKKIEGECFFKKPFEHRDIINEVNALLNSKYVSKSYKKSIIN